MKPGLELDRLVAEKVMGWEWGSNDIAAGLDAFMEWSEARTIHGPICKPGGWHVRASWGPSTNIAHAWELIDHMSASGKPLMKLNQGRCAPWFAGFGDLAWPGETAPHAICIAALKAVGVDIDSL